MAEEVLRSLEYTPTWAIAAVCSIIVFTSLLAEHGLHRIGKCLKRIGQDALYEALQKLKEELMLLGFISLLLTASQGPISNICISHHLASIMLPCKLPHESTEHFYLHQSFNNGRRHLLSEGSESQHCAHKGKVPLFSREAIHQLHLFVFILAVVHVIFCAATMVLGGLKIQQWKRWEQSSSTSNHASHELDNLQISKSRTSGYWRKYRPIGWMRSFFKQFNGSVTKSDYIALRAGFIQEHCPARPRFNFHKYMLRTWTFKHEFKRMVSISYLSPSFTSYGFHSCIMERIAYIIPRFVIGFIVQVLCSYITLPLYALVTQLGSLFKPATFTEQVFSSIDNWATGHRQSSLMSMPSSIDTTQINRLEREPYHVKIMKLSLHRVTTKGSSK
ncbi:hypothetical protein POM88_001613 [Heracleum sosnowskyi]|uniref:MLO-like protein n=1 Tax=Heracleum sosnowskyi TaxID=360622 RepID=A0AAD8JDW0_9APIA|nr:hypothetical protein POM88_001613 [Heracleum sosnowskyi]